MTQPDLARLEGLSTRLREMVSADGRSICCNKRTTAQMGSDILEAAVSLPALLARVRELESALTVAEESLDQMLDDMGETGQCVCPAAKFEAIDALANVRRTLNPTPTEER